MIFLNHATKLGVGNHLWAHLDLRELTLACLRVLECVSSLFSLVLCLNLGKDFETISCWLILPDQSRWVLGRVENGLQDVNLRRVVMPVELGDVAMLVTEHAAGAVHALLRVVESPAVLRLKLLVVALSGCLGELVLSMGESALILIPTLGCFDPVLAKLSLVFAISIAFLLRLIALGVGLVSIGTLIEAKGVIIASILAIESLGLLWC